MKLQQLALWLDNHIHVLESACANCDTQQLRVLSELAKAHPDMLANAFASVVTNVETERGAGVDCRQLSDTLNLMVQATSQVGKVSFVKSLQGFAEAISCRADASFSELVAAVEKGLVEESKKGTRRGSFGALQEDEIKAYLDQLEQALGDETEFDKAFETLKRDKRVKAQDAKNISKRFVGKAGRSKADALRLIYERHSSLVGSRARAKSTAGRSAA